MTLRQEIIDILSEYGFTYNANRSEKELIQLLKEKKVVNWIYVSADQTLSENFIRKFQDEVYWGCICTSQTLSENFIREFKDKVDWCDISCSQTLSENFIKEFQNKVDWDCINIYQNLSEELIKEFKDKVDWVYISKYQILSENFIREFQDKVHWSWISKHQTLSENFIREFKDKVDWDCINEYQKLSDEFRKEFNLEKPKNNWLYASKEDKEKFIKKHTDYEIKDNCVIAYKSVRKNLSSVYKPGLQYKIGETYTSSCDCNLDDHNSFGLAAWNKENALEYHNDGKLLKVSIPIEKLGACILNDNNKLRAFKMTILEEVEF